MFFLHQKTNGDDNDQNKANAQPDIEIKEVKTELITVKVEIESEDNDEAQKSGLDNDQEQLQLNVAESDKLDTSNADNEDSLNLTIGEEEAKIFQDEVRPFLIFNCHLSPIIGLICFLKSRISGN